MSKRFVLTPERIDALVTGHLNDPKTSGLIIKVLARGGHVWRYRWRLHGNGEMVKLTLRRYPQFSIADARAWADDLNAQIEGGIDPRIVAELKVFFGWASSLKGTEIGLGSNPAARYARASRRTRSTVLPPELTTARILDAQRKWIIFSVAPWSALR